MTVSRREAQEMLGHADRAGQAVEDRAGKEHMAFLGWSMFNALVIPGFDVFDRRMWGFVTIGTAIVGLVCTFAYFATRGVQVEVRQRSPWWLWPVLGLWLALAGVLSSVLDDTLAFSYTVGGLVGAAPLLAWGLHLRRTA